MAATDVSTLTIKVDPSSAVGGFKQATTSAREYTQQLENVSRATLNFSKSLTPATDALKRQTAETAAARAQAISFKQAMDGLYLSVDLAKSVNDKMTASLKNGKGDWIDMMRNMINAREGMLGVVGSAIRLGTNLYLMERALQTVTSVIKGIFGPMIESASAMERMAATYKVLGDTPAAGNELLVFTKELARYLPITVDALDKANRTLLGFNFTAKEIQEVLVRLADVTQGNSENFSHLALVYGQVRAQGKAMQQDMYQFVNAGIPIMEALADVLGKDTTAIRELVREGKIGLPEFEEALKRLTEEGGKFADFTEKTATIFQNQLVVAANNWKQILADIGNVILPTLSASLAISIDQMQKLLNSSDVAKRVLQTITIEQTVSGGDITGLESFFSSLSGVDPEEVKTWVGRARKANPLPTQKQFEALARAEELLTNYAARFNAPSSISTAPSIQGGTGAGTGTDNTIYGQLTASELIKAFGLYIDPSFYPMNMQIAPRYKQATNRDFGYQGDYITPELTQGMSQSLRSSILARITNRRTAPPVGGGTTARAEARIWRQLMGDTEAFGELGSSPSYGPGGKTRAQLAAQLMMDTTAYGAGRTAEYNPMAMPYPQTWWPAPTGEEAYTMPYVVGGGIPRGVSRAMGTELETGRPGARGASTAQEIADIQQLLALERERVGIWETLGESMEKGFKATSVSAFLDAMTELGRGTLNAEEAISAYLSTLAANMAPLFMEAGLNLIAFGAKNSDYASIAGGVALLAAGGFSAWASGALSATTSSAVKYNYGSVAQASNPYTGAILGSQSSVVINNIDQTSRGITVQTSTSTGPNGTKQITNTFRDALRTEIASGSMDSALRSRGLAANGAKARS